MTLMRFFFPSARSNLSPLNLGLPHPVRSACRFSQPLDGLLLKSPCDLVSCHWHSWDSPCRVFPLKTAPCPRRARIPCINVSFSTNNRRHVCWWIVELYPPEGTCGPTNTLDIWSYSVPKSVHILLRYYPQQEADTLLGFIYISQSTIIRPENTCVANSDPFHLSLPHTLVSQTEISEIREHEK
jgi:hypothetical protein